MTAAIDDSFRGLITPPPGEWITEALCAQTDLDAFHPVKGGSGKEAKKICGRCPVQRPCLRWAVQNNERSGIFGGLSSKERRGLTVEAVDQLPPVDIVEEVIPRKVLPLAVVPRVRPLPIPQPRPVPDEPEPVVGSPAKKTRARVAACGTLSGYARHKRRQEPQCDPCKAAQAEYNREWYRRKQKEKPAARVPGSSPRPTPPAPRPPTVVAKPVVRVMWLLPPTPGGSRTEYAMEGAAGELVPIHPHAAVEMAAAGEIVHCRHVTDWAPIGGTS